MGEAGGERAARPVTRARRRPPRLSVRVELPSGLEVQPEYVPTLLGGPLGELAAVVDIE